MSARSLLVVLLGAACTPSIATPTADPAGPTREAALVAFEVVRGVLADARCRNCHAAGDGPLQGEDGEPHAMNVGRGPDGNGNVGEECATCHGSANAPASYGLAIPPGAAGGWRMPKPDARLAFAGASPAVLCTTLRSARGGDLRAVRHSLEDPLATWGWEPGLGRKPIATPRAAFLTAFDAWASAGGPCPHRGDER